MALFLGCPMWGLKSWTGPFFPSGTKPRDYLATYSRRLNTVEGNTTFYALPDASLVLRWRDETPPGFRFCLKFPQTISHHRRLIDAGAETGAFIERLALLSDRCGPSFLQLPPTFGGKQLPVLASYLAALPKTLALAVEPRHADFFGAAESDFDALLRAHNAARCIFDTTALFDLPATHSAAVAEAQERKPKFAARHGRTGPFAFVRFVGQPDLEANLPWIDAWARRVIDWLRAGDDVYFFFHCPDDTEAPRLARMLHAAVGANVQLPALPDWGKPLQGSLF